MILPHGRTLLWRLAEHTVFSSRDEARLAIRRHRAERKCGQHAVRLARIRQRAGKDGG